MNSIYKFTCLHALKLMNKQYKSITTSLIKLTSVPSRYLFSFTVNKKTSNNHKNLVKALQNLVKTFQT